MGFDSGLYRAKRLKGITPRRLEILDSYLSYIKSDRTKEMYPTWEDYAKHWEAWKDVTDDDLEIQQVEKDFYINNENNQYEREFFERKTLVGEIESWCSDGRAFDDWFLQRTGGDNDEYIKPKELTKQDIIDCIKYVKEEYLSKREIKRVCCSKAFVSTGDPEDEIITLSNCNGIEVIDEEGNLQRLWTDSWEYSELVVVPNFDEWEDNAWMRLYDALIRILCEVDFEKEMILYGSGW